jgi:O-antigen/teichoic acid export membrane protein
MLNKLVLWLKQLPIYGKFGQDVAWNIGSLAILGISGIVLNVLIGRVYGVATVGVFNQVYAIYILLSQLAVGGIHFSVLKYVSQFVNNREICSQIISSAITITAFIAGLICFFVWLLHSWVGSILQSPGVALGLMYALPGLWCFALNKVLLSVLNGYRLMKAYAFGQGLRYVLMVVLLLICIITHRPGVLLPLIFSGTEIILFIGLIIYTIRFYHPVSPRKWVTWPKKHINFGVKAFAGGTLGEVNTRVDVLMLGFFTNDRIVGIYSFAAIFVEGITQLINVVRINLNPILAHLYADNQISKLKQTIHSGVKTFYPVMAVLGILSIAIFPFFVYLFLPASDFMTSWPVFCILMAGLMLSAGYMPFNMLLIQVGHPGSYTLIITLTVITNIVLNWLLIPWWSMYGAALATTISFILAIIFLKIFTWQKLRIHI